MQHLQVTADVSLPKTFVPTLIDLLNEPELKVADITDVADSLVRRNWLKDESGVWVGKAEYAQGRLLLNGQPFSMQSLMSDGGEEEEDDDEGEQSAPQPSR